MKNRAVFLDRDGTLIEEVGYAVRPEQIRILGGVARALARLADAGYKLVVVTNQSAIARGMLTEDELNQFHQALDEQLELLGARVDAYYTCPHYPDAAEAKRLELVTDCDCRKPKPGLILQAAEDLDIDLGVSWLVGDTWRDVQAGQAAGVRTIKLPAIPTRDAPRPTEMPAPTAVAAGLDEAADVILDYTDAPAPATEAASATTAAPASSAREELLADEPSPQEAPVAEAPAEEEPAEEASAEEAPAEEEPAEEASAEEAPAQEAPAQEAPAEETPSAAVATVPQQEEPVEAAAPAAPAAEVETQAVESGEEPAAPAAAQPPPPAAPEPEVEPARPPQAEQKPVIAPPPPRVVHVERTCARCGRMVAASEIASGAAVRRDGFLLCPECLPHQAAEGEDRLPTGATDLVRAILMELRRMSRTRRTSTLTFVRLVAYLVQAGAIFCGLVLVLVGADKAMYLQIAIFLELVVIALLLIERHS